MKAKLLPDLKWSSWVPHEFSSDEFCWLHDWREFTHLKSHKVELWKVHEGGKVFYEGYVQCGPYGETLYLREEFRSAKEAREAVERAVSEALKRGDLEK